MHNNGQQLELATKEQANKSGSQINSTAELIELKFWRREDVLMLGSGYETGVGGGGGSRA